MKSESTVSKQDSDIQGGTTELLNPSVLDEVLAEKKLVIYLKVYGEITPLLNNGYHHLYIYLSFVKV